jgi:hydroxyacylglutathione hydrolase
MEASTMGRHARARASPVLRRVSSANGTVAGTKANLHVNALPASATAERMWRIRIKIFRAAITNHDEALAKLGAMIHEILPVGMLACNCSIIGDEISREAIVIDPGDDISEITAVLKRHGLTVKTIVITHAHIDHIGGASKLRALTGAPVYMHEADSVLASNLEMQAQWLGTETPENPGIDTAAKEGDILHAGGIAAQVIHTPGHTPGSLSLFIPAEKKLIAGDTLFRGSVGRTDLPGGDFRAITGSIQGKLYALPEDTVVTPGHGDETTIGREKKTNAFVRG